MRETLSVLQGGVAAFAGSVAAGWIVLALLRARLQGVERFGLAAALGAGVYSTLLLPLFSMGQLRRSVATGLAAALVAGAVLLRKRVRQEDAQRGPWWWCVLTLSVSVLFTVVWSLNALAPDLTPPGMSPALEQASVLWAQHKLQPGEPLSAASPPWTAAFAAGRHSACSLLHVLMLCALAALAYGTGRRWLDVAGGSVAALLLISNPGLGAAASDAGTEVFLLLEACAAAAFVALAWKTAQPRLYAAAAVTGVMAGLLALDPQAEWFRGFLFGFVPGPWIVVPVLAALCAWLFHSSTASALLIVGFACLTSWPRITRMLAPSQTKIVMSANPGLALERKGVEEYLAKNLPGYTEARFLDEQTAEGSKILVEPKIARAWTKREVVTAEYWMPLALASFEDEYMPDREERIQVGAGPRTSYKLANGEWVAEVRFYRRGVETPRKQHWRVRCAQAFDNNPVTACREDIEVSFGEKTEFDEVRLQGKRGRPVRPPQGLRAAIVQEWKRQGVTHILAAHGGDLEDELIRHMPYWHVAELGERNGARLFRLE